MYTWYITLVRTVGCTGGLVRVHPRVHASISRQVCIALGRSDPSRAKESCLLCTTEQSGEECVMIAT